MPEKKGGKSPQARQAAKQQRQTVRLEGLTACRLAAALTQRELAEMVDSSQTTIADLENWDEADPGMLARLCGALHVGPADLISQGTVDEPVGQQGGDPRAARASAEAWIERRRQVNRIKKRGHFGNPYTGGHANVAPGTVLLRGLKGCRDSI